MPTLEERAWDEFADCGLRSGICSHVCTCKKEVARAVNFARIYAAEKVREAAKIVYAVPNDPLFDMDEGPCRRISSFAGLRVRALADRIEKGEEP